MLCLIGNSVHNTAELQLKTVGFYAESYSSAAGIFAVVCGSQSAIVLFTMTLISRLQLISLIIAYVVLPGHALTLSEVYKQMYHVHKDSVLTAAQSHPDYHRTKHREMIGSFRGKPIFNRQHSGFIDDNGVPVPVLPYAKSTEDNSESWRRG
uniref:PhoLip_ATPase_C domain-containing protein n=1 Tax=Steinernema glaseri TaxID=37863 RepID=A0A1I7YEY4_9BILA